MAGSERHSRLLALGAIGVAVFTIGVVVALLRLPEWRNRTLPDQSFFAARLQQIAGPAGLHLESAPRMQLRSRSIIFANGSLPLGETAYDVLGPRAADWLTREGRGPYVEAAAQSRWRVWNEAGQLRVLFSVRGVPVSAMWVADDPFHLPVTATGPPRLELDRLFLPAAREVPTIELHAMSQVIHLAAVPGSTPPESLLSAAIGGPVEPVVQRVVGSADWWRNRLVSMTIGSLVTGRIEEVTVHTVFAIGVLVLFFVLLVRRRIELRKGLVLAAISIALSLPAPLWSSTTWLQAAQTLNDVLIKALVLFVFWSAAESWLRSTVPGFRTSLDTLRAGRLGPKGGRALLAGWSIGASVAGLWLIAVSVGTMVPGVATTEGSIRMPFFGVERSPIDDGAFRTALIMLVICAALRFPLLRRLRGGATILGAAVMAVRIPLSSFWFAFAVALLLTAVLVYAYTEFGLTALLTAAMMSAVLPAALFSLLHVSWMPVSALLLGIVAVAPLPLGLIGLKRDAEAEEGPLPLPRFALRLEEENRLKYEMDLLARMQLGLLPKEMPRVEGYEIAARSILATEAGGDLYDFVHDSLGRIWIAAGDVSGHGYSCAIAQAMTKAGLASLVEAERTPATVLQRLDLVLRGIDSPRTFTSLVLLRLDPSTGEVLVSNAGHPYPWIATRSGVREMELPSLPLGLGPAREYGDTPLSMKIGATVVLFSDGLFEAGDAHGRPYGFDRFRELLGKVSRRPASAILTAIVEDWRAHAGPAAPADDTTIVVVKRSG
jgi:phosphoserine phosphatase RsbU/P